jgi:hypothetical protein
MFDKTSMMVLGMAGAFALGLAVGPQLDANRLGSPAPPPAPLAAASEPPSRPVALKVEVNRARAKAKADLAQLSS